MLTAASCYADSALCHAAAVLRNGFAIPYVRSEAAGPVMRLWLCAEAGAGYVEIPSGQIESFEQRESAIPLAEAAPPEITAKTTTSSIVPVEVPIKSLIAGAAWRYRLDADFVTSVVKAESAFNPAAISPKGARGLMQLMPLTAAKLGVEDSLDPAANVEAGTRYLRQLLDRYDGDAVKALAAYNAGPERVEQYGGIPPYRETRDYVARIIGDYNRKKLRQQADGGAPPAGK
jgi:hypothetical protein